MSDVHRSNLEIIGRDDIDDVDAILAATDIADRIDQGGTTTFTWDYERSRDQLSRLYEKAKTSQWNATTDLDWETPVDQEAMGAFTTQVMPEIVETRRLAPGDPTCPVRNWGDREFARLGFELQAYSLSQFLHGEQGALVCTAKIVEQVPWVDAKYYASTQVMDEARHVEVFARYLREKLEGEYPINAQLMALLVDIIRDERWDMTYLGMQIMVEGLALAAFSLMSHAVDEPLLKRLLRLVMSDEARHVAFGVLSLREVYDSMTSAEIRERQEFAFEAGLRMRDRLVPVALWETLDVDPDAMVRWWVGNLPRSHTPILFSKIVPNVKKLGLLDAGVAEGEKGWLRRKYEEMGVIQFEDWADTSVEYELLDAVAASGTEA